VWSEEPVLPLNIERGSSRGAHAGNGFGQEVGPLVGGRDNGEVHEFFNWKTNSPGVLIAAAKP
jgi:hypothetical protein